MGNHRKILGAALVSALVFCLAQAAWTQDKKREAHLRTVHGSVVDHEENPLPSSVVYLKNVRTQAVKTYIADDTGNYRFSGLDPNVDYEIHAQKGDSSSPVRRISSFDNRKDIEVILKIEKKKGSG